MKVGLYLGTALSAPTTCGDCLLACACGIALGVLAASFI